MCDICYFPVDNFIWNTVLYIIAFFFAFFFFLNNIDILSVYLFQW